MEEQKPIEKKSYKKFKKIRGRKGLSGATISKVMSFLGKQMSPLKKETMSNNGKRRRNHFHNFPDGIKCETCGKYLSQFEGRDPNGGYSWKIFDKRQGLDPEAILAAIKEPKQEI